MRTLGLTVLFWFWTLASPVYAQLPCGSCVEAEPLRTTYVTEHSFGPFATGHLEVTEGAFYALLADRWKTYSGSCAATFTPLGTWTDGTGWQRNGSIGWYRVEVSSATATNACPDYITFRMYRWEFLQCQAGATPWLGSTDVPYCEGPPKRKVVVLDPGHGFDCTAVGQKVGAVGRTNFPASSPPAGFLKEEAVVLEIAEEVKRQMDSASVQVLLTKNRVNECPTFLDRGRFSNTHGAKAFVSIHADAPNIIERLSDSGSLGIYYPNSFVAQGFAQRLASDVSSRLGLNNRGAAPRNDLAVLKPAVTFARAKALLEVGRLSGNDEVVLHAPVSGQRAASGIKSATDAYLANP